MSPSRGQTTLDFAIGISVFLAVLVFVFSFVPGLLAPFTASGNDLPALADRTADRLSQGSLGNPENGSLGHPEEPYVLNGSDTEDFFAASEEASERLDLPQGRSVNVTVAGDTDDDGQNDILCRAGGSLSESSCGGTTLVAGDVPPSDNAATVTARRVVALDGEDVTLEVIVW